MAREPVLEDFAVALRICLPTGDIEGEGRVGRTASSARPFGLMHTDAKVVQAAVSHSLSEQSRGTHVLSREDCSATQESAEHSRHGHAHAGEGHAQSPLFPAGPGL